MKNFNFLKVATTAFTLTLLIAVVAACNNSTSPNDHDHEDAEGFRIYSDSIMIVEQLPDQDLTGEIELFENDTSVTYNISFLDHDALEFTPEDEEYSLGHQFGLSGIAQFDYIEDETWAFQLSGIKADSTALAIFLLHGDHPDFISQFIPIYVNQAE